MPLPSLQPRYHARLAGLLYLIIIVCGISSEIAVRSSMILWDDAAATAANITAASGLFKAGFFLDLLMILSDVAIALVFYLIFEPVNRFLVLGTTLFRLIQAAILGSGLLLYFAALLVLQADGLNSVSQNETALLFLRLHAHGYDLGLVFFAVSCLFMGLLILRSGYVPAVIGYGMIASGAVYFAGSVTRFLAPEYSPMLDIAYLIPFAAELSFALWLLLRGVRSA